MGEREPVNESLPLGYVVDVMQDKTIRWWRQMPKCFSHTLKKCFGPKLDVIEMTMDVGEEEPALKRSPRMNGAEPVWLSTTIVYWMPCVWRNGCIFLIKVARCASRSRKGKRMATLVVGRQAVGEKVPPSGSFPDHFRFSSARSSGSSKWVVSASLVEETTGVLQKEGARETWVTVQECRRRRREGIVRTRVVASKTSPRVLKV